MSALTCASCFWYPGRNKGKFSCHRPHKHMKVFFLCSSFIWNIHISSSSNYPLLWFSMSSMHIFSNLLWCIHSKNNAAQACWYTIWIGKCIFLRFHSYWYHFPCVSPFKVAFFPAVPPKSYLFQLMKYYHAITFIFRKKVIALFIAEILGD